MYYIRLNDTTPDNWYWMQNAQNWTRTPSDATLFETEREAYDEMESADLAGEVCLKK